MHNRNSKSRLVGFKILTLTLAIIVLSNYKNSGVIQRAHILFIFSPKPIKLYQKKTYECHVFILIHNDRPLIACKLEISLNSCDRRALLNKVFC